jgi:type VI secretion system protein ImpF
MHPGAHVPRKSNVRVHRANTRLLSTLFDRLSDDAPHRATEAADEYTVSTSQLRAIVQRDLGLLLNTTNVEDLIDRSRYADAAMSTINYGVPPLAGSYLSARKWSDIEKIITRSITDYEPRLISKSLQVKPLAQEGAGDGYNVLSFEIRAMIKLEPCPLELMVQSSIDLETNRIRIVHTSRGPTREVR